MFCGRFVAPLAGVQCVLEPTWVTHGANPVRYKSDTLIEIYDGARRGINVRPKIEDRKRNS